MPRYIIESHADNLCCSLTHIDWLVGWLVTSMFTLLP